MDSLKAEILPSLTPGAPGIPDRSRYREQYGVIVICPDEETQRRIFEGLQAVAGAKLKVVVT
jgi:hypothetical protein